MSWERKEGEEGKKLGGQPESLTFTAAADSSRAALAALAPAPPSPPPPPCLPDGKTGLRAAPGVDSGAVAPARGAEAEAEADESGCKCGREVEGAE